MELEKMKSKSPEWIHNLQIMLNRLEDIKQLPAKEKGIHLHLGCGPHILDGFINIDKYYKHKQVLQYDMYEVPFGKNTVDTIYSSHALEHLPIRYANAALYNWFDSLRVGGKLFLAVPDLEEIMSIMLDPSVDENAKWNWYVYTLFGYQVTPGLQCSTNDSNTPSDPGQFHTTGFTKSRIKSILESIGFNILEMFSYDGWSTPSIWVEARKD